jgi:hypothetical protein
MESTRTIVWEDDHFQTLMIFFAAFVSKDEAVKSQEARFCFTFSQNRSFTYCAGPKARPAYQPGVERSGTPGKHPFFQYSSLNLRVFLVTLVCGAPGCSLGLFATLWAMTDRRFPGDQVFFTSRNTRSTCSAEYLKESSSCKVSFRSRILSIPSEPITDGRLRATSLMP